MRKSDMTQILAWLTAITRIPHVFVRRDEDRVCGDVLYALAVGTRVYLVCSDSDAPMPRHVVAPLELWDADNAIEALPDTPLLTVRALGKLELEEYFGISASVPAMLSTERSSMVSLVGGRA